MRAYTIDLGSEPYYEAGALLVTLLAFPKETRSEKRLRELHNSVCAKSLRDRALIEPDWANVPQCIKPIHIAPTSDKVKKDLRTLERRLRDRMVASRPALAILFDLKGFHPKLPKDVRNLSIKQLMNMALDDLEQDDVENVEQRVWRESLPIIHLAAAAQNLMNLPGVTVPGLPMGHIIFVPEITRWVTATAMEAQELILSNPARFRVNPDDLIRLELIEC